MKLIVGLGNPGAQYKKTRHNVGFLVLDEIAKRQGLVFKYDSSFKVKIAEMDIDGKFKLVQPETYMNDSGRTILKIKNYWKIETENVWLVSDDVDLDLGKIRINFGGSSAGHKGVQSVIDNIGENFWRIRIGIGKSKKVTTDKWVLQKFAKNESEIIVRIVDTVADLMLESLSSNLKEETIKI